MEVLPVEKIEMDVTDDVVVCQFLFIDILF